jgi:uncharacterized protein
MTRITLLLIALLVPGATILGQGNEPGHQAGHQASHQDSHQKDMQTIHALFSDHQKITRTVKLIDGGFESVTESDDPKVQSLITAHAVAMKERLVKGQPIRMWDPLFAALFEHAAKISIEVIPIAKGVRIVETSKDPYVIKLIQSHAAGVSEFVKEGMSVMHKSHPLPQ